MLVFLHQDPPCVELLSLEVGTCIRSGQTFIRYERMEVAGLTVLRSQHVRKSSSYGRRRGSSLDREGQLGRFLPSSLLASFSPSLCSRGLYSHLTANLHLSSSICLSAPVLGDLPHRLRLRAFLLRPSPPSLDSCRPRDGDSSRVGLQVPCSRNKHPGSCWSSSQRRRRAAGREPVEEGVVVVGGGVGRRTRRWARRV